MYQLWLWLCIFGYLIRCNYDPRFGLERSNESEERDRKPPGVCNFKGRVKRGKRHTYIYRVKNVPEWGIYVYTYVVKVEDWGGGSSDAISDRVFRIEANKLTLIKSGFGSHFSQTLFFHLYFSSTPLSLKSSWVKERSKAGRQAGLLISHHTYDIGRCMRALQALCFVSLHLAFAFCLKALRVYSVRRLTEIISLQNKCLLLVYNLLPSLKKKKKTKVDKYMTVDVEW